MELPPQTLKNGTLYVHAIVTKLMSSREPNSNMLLSKHTFTAVAFITKYAQPKEKIFNLLKSNQNDTKPTKFNPVTHWKSKLVINAMKAPFNMFLENLPLEISHLIQLDSKHRYMPIVYISDSRFSSQDLMPISKGQNTMPLHVTYEPLTIGRIRFLVLLDRSFHIMKGFGFGDREIDDVKGIFFDTNSHMLLLTIIIVSVHVSFL